MKAVKTLCSLILLALVSQASFAQQTVKGLTWNEQTKSSINIVNLDASTGQISSVVQSIKLQSDQKYVTNTLHHDANNNLLYFQVEGPQGFSSFVGQELKILRASTGESLKDLSLSNAMAPFIVSERNQLGFIGTERESHGYGNNDDNISMVVFDMNTGKTTARVELSNLSFAPVNAPFVGEVLNNNGTKFNKDVALSSTCYLPETGEIVFAAKDVLNTQRLFRVNIKSGKLVSSNSISDVLLDMVYDESSKSIHALYVRTDKNGKKTLEVGLLDLNRTAITSSKVLRSIEDIEFPIMEGSIQCETGNLYVTKKDAFGYQVVYTIGSENLDIINTTKKASSLERSEFIFPYTYTLTPRPTLMEIVKMNPNPANGSVTVASYHNAVVKYVIIRNDVGQVVQEIQIESGLAENKIDISALASGLYMIEIQTNISTPVNQKLIVR